MISKIDFFIMGELCFHNPVKDEHTANLRRSRSLPNEIIEHDLAQLRADRMNAEECRLVDELESQKIEIKKQYIDKIQSYFREGGVDLSLGELKKVFETKEVLSDKWLQKALADQVVT
mgnify:CR=1 FL=1